MIRRSSNLDTLSSTVISGQNNTNPESAEKQLGGEKHIHPSDSDSDSEVKSKPLKARDTERYEEEEQLESEYNLADVRNVFAPGEHYRKSALAEEEKPRTHKGRVRKRKEKSKSELVSEVAMMSSLYNGITNSIATLPKIDTQDRIFHCRSLQLTDEYKKNDEKYRDFVMGAERVFEQYPEEKLEACLREIEKVKSGTATEQRRQCKLSCYKYYDAAVSYYHDFFMVYVQNMVSLLPQVMLENDDFVQYVDEVLRRGIQAWHSHVARMKYSDIVGEIRIGDYKSDEFKEKIGDKKHFGLLTSSTMSGDKLEYEQLQVTICEVIIALHHHVNECKDVNKRSKIEAVLRKYVISLQELLDKKWTLNHEDCSPKVCYLYLAACTFCGCFKSLGKNVSSIRNAGKNYQASCSEGKNEIGFFFDIDYMKELLSICRVFCPHSLKYSRENDFSWKQIEANHSVWAFIYSNLRKVIAREIAHRHQVESGRAINAEKKALLDSFKVEVDEYKSAYEKMKSDYADKVKNEIQAWLDELEKGSDDSRMKKSKDSYVDCLSSTQKKKRKKKMQGAAKPSDEGKSHAIQSPSLVEAGIDAICSGNGDEAKVIFGGIERSKDSTPIDRAWSLLYLGNLALRGCHNNVRECYKAKPDIDSYHAEVQYCLENQTGLPDKDLYEQYISSSDTVAENLDELSIAVQCSKNYYSNLVKLVFETSPELKEKTKLLDEVNEMMHAKHRELDRIKQICKNMMEAHDKRITILKSLPGLKKGASQQTIENREHLDDVRKKAAVFCSVVSDFSNTKDCFLT